MRRRPALVLASALLPLALLAGCGGAPGAAGPVAASPRLGAHTPLPSDEAGPGGTGGDGLASSLALTEPARLRGLTIVQVQAALGAPAFKRRDAPAEIWQYRGHRCTLDLFIYESGGGQRVEHYTVRSPAPVAERDCFDELMAHSSPGS